MPTAKPYDMALHQLMQVQGDAFIASAYSLVLMLVSGRGKELNTQHMDFIPLLTSLWILRSAGMKIDSNFVNITDNKTEIEEVLNKMDELCSKLSAEREDGEPIIMMTAQNAKA